MNAEFCPAPASVRPARSGPLAAGDIRLSPAFLLVTLRFPERGFRPIGVLIRPVAAAATAAMAIALLAAAFLPAG